MYCKNCGKEVNGDFCPNCGTKSGNNNQPITSQPVNNTQNPRIPHYIVLQVILKEKFIGTGSKNLTELEHVINNQAAKGYKLHTISTTSSGSTGMLGGDRIQATLVFEKI